MKESQADLCTKRHRSCDRRDGKEPRAWNGGGSSRRRRDGCPGLGGNRAEVWGQEDNTLERGLSEVNAGWIFNRKMDIEIEM